MRTSPRLGLLALAVPAVLPLLATATAYATPQPAPTADTAQLACAPGSGVDDRADVLDDARVEEAIASGFGDDIVVRVLALPALPAGRTDLASVVDDAMVDCQGWGQSGDQSVLVLGVSVREEEFAEVFAGPYEDVFQDVYDSEEAYDAMASRYDWTESVVAGLEVYAETYADGPEGKPLPWWLVGGPAGVAVLGAGAYGGLRLRRHRKRTAAARAELSAATDAMAQAWLALEEGQEYVDARVAALPQVDDTRVAAVRATHAEAVAARQRATTDYLAITERLPATAIARLDVEEASREVAPVRAATEALTEAKATQDRVEAEVSAFEALREALPGRVAALRAHADQVEQLLAARQAEGYLVAGQQPAPAAARVEAGEAEALVDDLRFGDADRVLAEADAELSGVEQWLRGLDDFRAALAKDLTALTARLPVLDRALADGAASLDAVEERFGSANLGDAREALAAAEVSRARLDGRVTVIETNASMQHQEFAYAREQLDQAHADADAVAAAAAAPAGLEQRLATLAAELPLTAERLQAEARGVADRMAEQPGAMSYLTDPPAPAQLAEEAAVLAERSREPGVRLADVEAEVGALSERVEAARATVERAVSDHAAAERDVRTAEAAIAEARREVLDPDAGSGPRSQLEAAEALLQQAAQASSLPDVSTLARRAAGQAHEAAAEARRDARSAQAARDRRRRSYSSSSGSWGGFSSSSRSSWSSRSSRSGGSSRRRSGGGSRSRRSGGGSRRR